MVERGEGAVEHAGDQHALMLIASGLEGKDRPRTNPDTVPQLTSRAARGRQYGWRGCGTKEARTWDRRRATARGAGSAANLCA